MKGVAMKSQPSWNQPLLPKATVSARPNWPLKESMTEKKLIVQQQENNQESAADALDEFPADGGG